MNISVNIEINQPKDIVWAAITNIEQASDMISGIIDLTVLEKPKEGIVGLKWTETREMFGKPAEETMWITEAKEGDYYYTRAENHGSIYITKMSVSEIQNRTLLTMAFSATSDSFFVKVLSSIMGIFIKKSMIRMLKDDLNDIKTFLEK